MNKEQTHQKLLTTPDKKPSFRITERGKAVGAILALIGIGVAAHEAQDMMQDQTKLVSETITISGNGDTIWNEVEKLPLDGMSTGDAVTEIVDGNKIDVANIHPGDTFHLTVDIENHMKHQDK